MTCTAVTPAAIVAEPLTPNETRALARETTTDLMWTAAGLDHAQRLARLYAASPLVPEHLRSKKGGELGTVANLTIALLMAKRMNEDPLVTMQSIYIVSGKAGWTSQYLIARANKSGVFRGRIGWKVARLTPPLLEFKRKTKVGWDEGANRPVFAEKAVTMPNLSVTAFATLADTGEHIEYEVNSRIAIDEGWADNAKYSTLGELMLRYRSAAFLVRLYAPDVMLGSSTTVEELDDLTASGRIVAPPPHPTESEPAPTGTGRSAGDALMAILGPPAPASTPEVATPAPVPAPPPLPVAPPPSPTATPAQRRSAREMFGDDDPDADARAESEEHHRQ